MTNGTVFGMITTTKSNHFTTYALNSFFATTQLKDEDLFILIDNDDTWDDLSYPWVNLVKNTAPMSFAANINQVLRIADERELDLVMMNNDVVFTPGWRESLEQDDTIICIPSCNQTHTYFDNDNKPYIPNVMNLLEYNGNYLMLREVAKHHTTSNQGYYEKFHTAFYLFRLPRKIYIKVGLFDENFVPAGGEDVDYRIRAAQAGFKTLYTNDSYVLHFHGKSSWDGAEDKRETQQRNSAYFQQFIKKYGEDLAHLCLQIGNPAPVVKKLSISDSELASFTDLIRKLSGLESIKKETAAPLDQISAPELLPYIEQLGHDLVGCELGVCLGFTLRYFFDMTDRIGKVYAIDAYKPYMDHWGPVTQELVDNWKAGAHQLLEPYKDKIEFIEMDSFLAADKIPAESLDYIFIDGDHSYAAVARDLRRYWSKVKPGGIFAGHDWNLSTVKTAVEHFRQERNINSKIHHVKSNVWFWYKGE
jgi:GT2 family glycosyltransferase